MKSEILKNLVAYFDGKEVENLETLKAEIKAEYEREVLKKDANRKLYAAAHDVLLGVLDSTPRTAQELYDSTSDWPESFKFGKLKYALSNYWSEDVNKIVNSGRSPHTYTKK